VKALVLFHSQEFGNTRAMAKAVGEGLGAGGASASAEVTLHNTNDARFDVAAYAAYDCVAVGTPDYYSYIAGGLKVFLDDWHIAKGKGTPGLADKPYALFYSHGGGGKVKEPFEKLFDRLGTKVGETVESKGAPSDEVLAECRKLGEALAGAGDKTA
jgi:flavorubredoxin